MPHPDAALRELMKDVGKILRPLGFKGSVSRWRRPGPEGLVEIQRWNTSFYEDGCSVKRFGFLGGAIPTEWWRYQNWRSHRAGEPPLLIEQVESPEVVDREDVEPRLRPLWDLRSDPAGLPYLTVADSEVERIREQLPDALTALADRSMRLVEPGACLRHVRSLGYRHHYEHKVIVVLLAGNGPSDELDAAIDDMEANTEYPGEDEERDLTLEYVRDRLAGLVP